MLKGRLVRVIKQHGCINLNSVSDKGILGMKTFVIDSPGINLKRKGVKHPLFFCGGVGAAVAVVFGITFIPVATV